MHFDLLLLSTSLQGIKLAVEQEEGTLLVAIPWFAKLTRHGPFKVSMDLNLQWHYMVLFDTESDAIKVCGTYDGVEYYVILYVHSAVYGTL